MYTIPVLIRKDRHGLRTNYRGGIYRPQPSADSQSDVPACDGDSLFLEDMHVDAGRPRHLYGRPYVQLTRNGHTEVWHQHGRTHSSRPIWNPAVPIKDSKAKLLERVLCSLAELEPLRAELKRRAMIFQCEWKEAQAMAEGKPYDAYHELSYKDWEKIRDSRYG
jgi:hypothetical protein